MADQSGKASTSIDELVATFREALEVLVPSMEKVRLPWREGEAYDEWDSVAEALFLAIIDSSVADRLIGFRPLHRFGFELPVLEPPSVICVSSMTDPLLKGALICFPTVVRPFDMAECKLLTSGWTQSSETIKIPVGLARFSLLLRNDACVEEIFEVEIPF